MRCSRSEAYNGIALEKQYNFVQQDRINQIKVFGGGTLTAIVRKLKSLSSVSPQAKSLDGKTTGSIVGRRHIGHSGCLFSRDWIPVRRTTAGYGLSISLLEF